MIVHPKYIYGVLVFAFPRKSRILVDDTTHTISKKCDWIDSNVPPVFSMASREWKFFRIDDFPESHHID